MRKWIDAVCQFAQSEDGPTAVEYAVMLALIFGGLRVAHHECGNNDQWHLQQSQFRWVRELTRDGLPDGGIPMIESVWQYWSWMATNADPQARNVLTLVACIALYTVFLARGRDRSYKRTGRFGRNPDSVLRGGGR